MEKELQDLCETVLKEAQAKENTADLIRQAEFFKPSINEMRDFVKNFLENEFESSNHSQLNETERFEKIKELENKITEKYRLIMYKVA